MNARGEAFLAYAGFAAEQHGSAPLRDVRGLLQNVAHDFGLRNERGVGTGVLIFGNALGHLTGKSALTAEGFLHVGGFIGDEGRGDFHEHSAFFQIFTRHEFRIGVQGADDFAGREGAVSGSERSKSRLRKRESPLSFSTMTERPVAKTCPVTPTPGA